MMAEFKSAMWQITSLQIYKLVYISLISSLFSVTIRALDISKILGKQPSKNFAHPGGYVSCLKIITLAIAIRCRTNVMS